MRCMMCMGENLLARASSCPCWSHCFISPGSFLSSRAIEESATGGSSCFPHWRALGKPRRRGLQLDNGSFRAGELRGSSVAAGARSRARTTGSASLLCSASHRCMAQTHHGLSRKAWLQLAQANPPGLGLLAVPYQDALPVFRHRGKLDNGKGKWNEGGRLFLCISYLAGRSRDGERVSPRGPCESKVVFKGPRGSEPGATNRPTARPTLFYQDNQDTTGTLKGGVASEKNGHVAVKPRSLLLSRRGGWSIGYFSPTRATQRPWTCGERNWDQIDKGQAGAARQVSRVPVRPSAELDGQAISASARGRIAV